MTLPLLRARTTWTALVGVILAVAAALTLAASPAREPTAGVSLFGGGPGPVDVLLRQAASVATGAGPLVGKLMPQVTLIGLDGRPVTTEAAAGRPSVVLLWSPACACGSYYAAANGVATEAGGRTYVYGLVSDPQGGGAAIGDAARVAFQEGLLFPSALDRNGDVVAALGATVPRIMVVAPDGRIVADYPRQVPTAVLVEFLRRRFP